MPDEREMTLDEWCDRLPNHHLVNRQLAELKELESRQQQWIPVEEIIRCLDNAYEHIQATSYNDALSSIREAQEYITPPKGEDDDQKTVI